MIKNLVVTVLAFFAFYAEAQAEGGGGGGSAYEAGLHTGFLLPNHIEGVTEIMALTGFRAAMRFPGDFFIEAGAMAGNGDGQQWKNVHLDGRLDFPVESIVAMTYFGADMNYYSGPGITNTVNFGAHLGGGFKSEIGRGTWLRTDMKFNGQPGTSLFFGFGLEFHFGGSAG